MKNKKKLIIFSLVIFILATIASSYWYISLHYYREGNLKNLSKIITQVGLFGGFFTTLFFLLINICISKMKDKGFRTFLVVILIIFFIVFIYQLTLNMVFYQTDDPSSFIGYFFGL